MNKRTGPLPHTDELAEHKVPQRLRCPICGGMVTYSVKAGARIVDYHHDTRKPDWFKWCDGSDYNMSEIA